MKVYIIKHYQTLGMVLILFNYTSLQDCGMVSGLLLHQFAFYLVKYLPRGRGVMGAPRHPDPYITSLLPRKIFHFLKSLCHGNTINY